LAGTGRPEHTSGVRSSSAFASAPLVRYGGKVTIGRPTGGVAALDRGGPVISAGPLKKASGSSPLAPAGDPIFPRSPAALASEQPGEAATTAAGGRDDGGTIRGNAALQLAVPARR